MFLLGADGKGTIRLLSGFSAVVAGNRRQARHESGADHRRCEREDQDDILIISPGKVIRFNGGSPA